MTRQTILLTGATGVVGSALLRQLHGHPLIALAHRKPLSSVVSVHGDITRPWLGLTPSDYRDLAAKVDVVVHCAASVNFGASPATLHKVNVRGVGQVLRFVADSRARLIHVSTAFVTRPQQPPDSGDRELTLGDYARSKTRGEILIRESGLPAVIARVSTVIGDSATGKTARLQAFHYLLGAAMHGLVPFLPCEPGTCIDLIAQDTVAAELAALAKADTAHGEYWITAGPAALPLQRVIDIAYEVILERHRRDKTAPKMYMEAFKPRLLQPETYDQVISMALAPAGPDAKPSGLMDLRGLMATYNGASPFPTTLGQLPGGPAALTEADVEHALTSMCHHLTTLPQETWNPY